ncbi:MAG: histidine kinase [Bacteroidota bacterium]
MWGKTIIAFLLGSICIEGLGQQKETPARLDMIWDRINHALMVDRDLALAENRIDTMMRWAQSEGNIPQLAAATQAKAQMHYYRAEYDTCLQLTKVAQKYFEGFQPDQVLKSNNMMANVHQQQGNMDSVFYFLGIARKGLEALGDSNAYVMTYNDLGRAYFLVGKPDSAAYYHTEQLRYIAPKDSFNLFGTYINLLKIYRRLNDFDNSLEVADQAIAVSQGRKYPNSLARAKSAKAELLMAMGQNEAAEQLAMEAVELHEANGFKRNTLPRYATLAKALLRNKKLGEASAALGKIPNPEAEQNLEFKAGYYLTALELAIEGQDLEESRRLLKLCEALVERLGQKEIETAFRLLRAKYFIQIGLYREASAELFTYLEQNDSIISIKNQMIAANLRAMYETAEKEKQISNQQLALSKAQSRNMQILITLGALLVLGGVYYGFSKRQAHIKSALQESEIDALKRENKLIAMQSLLSGQEEERRRIAQDLHDNIGSLMTSLKMKVLGIQRDQAQTQLSNLVAEVDSIIDQTTTEVRRISHNMTPVAMELTGLSGAVEDLAHQLTTEGIRADFDLDSLEAVEDQDKAVIIYRIIQELVQNVSKHSQAVTCSLKSGIIGPQLVLEFIDDGNGLPQGDWSHAKGMGLKGIRSRVEYLEGEIHMENVEGTRFYISLPL